MKGRSPLALVALATAWWIPNPDAAAQEEIEKKTLPVTVHLLSDGEGAAASQEDIDRWLKKASAHFAKAGIAFEGKTSTEEVPSAEVNSVAHRNSLVGRSAWDGTIHLFVARRVADKDKEGGWIAGVHWRYWGMAQAKKKQHCIILSASACGVDTLAHELGHFFGEAHTDDPDNLMDGSGRHAGAKFDEEQIRRMRAEAARMIGGPELNPLTPETGGGGGAQDEKK